MKGKPSTDRQSGGPHSHRDSLRHQGTDRDVSNPSPEDASEALPGQSRPQVKQGEVAFPASGPTLDKSKPGPDSK
jgi:hypothetical protein